MMRMKKRSPVAMGAAALLAAGVAVGFFTSAKASPTERLTESVVCSAGVVSFSLPAGEDGWSLFVSGRKELDGLGGMSVHYLDGVDWEGGKTDSFDVSGGGYTDLTLTARLGGDAVTVDILPLLPDHLKRPQA